MQGFGVGKLLYGRTWAAVFMLVLASFFIPLSSAKAEYCDEMFDTPLGRDGQDPSVQCRTIASYIMTVSGHTTEVFVMHHVDPSRADGGRPARYLEILSAVEDAVNATGPKLSELVGFRMPPVVHIIIVPQAHTGDGRMRTVPQVYLRPTRMRDCPMIIYGNGAGQTAGALRRSLSHEFFHCVQYETFHGKVGSDAARWWMEGSAEWFEDFVFPALVGDSDLDRVIRLFTERSRDYGLHENLYANAVFFAWLHQRGRNAIFNYLSRLSGDGEDQLAGMRTALSQDDYNRFAQAYLDDEIVFPSGRRVEGSTRPLVLGRTTGEPEADPNMQKAVRKAFTIVQEKVEFVPGEYRPKGGMGSSERIFSESPGVWEKLPASLIIRCGENKNYKIAAMPAADTPPPLEVKPQTSKAVQCGECGATGGEVRRAGCVVGSWRLSEGSGGNCDWLVGMMGNIPGMSVSVEECLAGQANVTFNRDGTFGGMLTNARRQVLMSLPVRGSREAPQMRSTAVIAVAKSAGQWRAAEEGGELALCNASTTGSGHITMSGDGFSRTMPIPFSPSAFVALNYSCSGNQMTITVPSPGPNAGSFSVELERVSAQP